MWPFNKPPQIIYQQALSWIDANKLLPEMFEVVLVYAVHPKFATGYHAFEARRWTGLTSGFDVEAINGWEWLTTYDYTIDKTKVLFWLHLPKVVPILPEWRSKKGGSVD